MSDTSLPHTFTRGGVEDGNQLQEQFERLLDAVNLDVDSGIGEPAGLSAASTVRRGKAIIATEQSTTSTTYTTLTTPDSVSDVVVPSGGSLVIDFNALFKHTGASTNGAAAIFIGGTQLRKAAINDAPAVAEQAVTTNASVKYGFLYTGDGTDGLTIASSATTDASIVTTGMVYPATHQPIEIKHLTAGTYTVSVQVKAGTGGTFTMKSRELRVWTRGY